MSAIASKIAISLDSGLLGRLDAFNQKSGTVIAVALTSQPQKAGFPLTYLLESMLQRQKAWVKISQIRTLSILRVGAKIGHVHLLEVNKILEGLNEIIG